MSFLAILAHEFRGNFGKMKKTKLVKLLKNFSKSDINKLRDFVNSPYFNKNKNVIGLCEKVLEYYPGFESGSLTEENIFRKLYGNEKYDYFRLKNIISDLYALALLFLKFSRVQNRDPDNEIILLNVLHDMKLDNIYEQREKKVKSRLLNSEIMDEDNYLRQYQLERINIAHYKFEGSSYAFNKIQLEFDSFMKYSLTGLLRLYSKMLHNKNHGNVEFNMEMFENVWEYIKERDFPDNPSCNIYKQIIQLELAKEEEAYRKLLRIKDEYKLNLPREEYYYILLVQNSFAAYRLKLGDESYYKERFNAFREMVEQKFYAPDNLIFPNFISAFTSACMAGEYDWAEKFFKDYQKGISPQEEKMSTLNYCNAFMAYRLKDFDKALVLFSKTNFRLYLMKVMVKSYSVRIYYEQGLIEQTLSAVDTFRHYLRSEKLMAEDQKTAQFEFLKYLSELAKFRLEEVNRDNVIEFGLLKKNISMMSSNPLGAKNWLIEKAAELSKKGAN